MKTATVLKQATRLLGRDLYAKERDQLAGRELERAERSTHGGRPSVAITFAAGSGVVLRPHATGGTVFRYGRPLAPKVLAAAEPVLVVAAPAAVATPRERRDRRASSPTRAGPDDDPDEPEPPPRRLCAFCNDELGRDRAQQARYCSDKHAAADRKRRQRARARDLAPRIPTTADFERMRQFEPGELERLLDLALCRCNGHHSLERDPQLDRRCWRCGRQRPDSAVKPRLGMIA